MKTANFPFLMIILQSKYVMLFIFTCSIAALSIALIYQYILGYAPCYLCVYERVPYIFLIIGTSYCLFLKHSKLWILVIYLSIIAAVTISIYHTGIERGIFDPTEHCKTKINYDVEIEDLRSAVFNAGIADCSKPAVKILKLSMTEWNVLANIFFLFVMIIRNKGHKQLKVK